jgi:uncharacterized membrane protein YeaQ/YmgE (transglycosylase-associated protein family)
MSWYVALVVGAIVGWLASLALKRKAAMRPRWYVAVGIVGATVGNAVVAPLVGLAGPPGSFAPAVFIPVVLGAIVLLAAVQFARRGGGGR